MHDETRTREKTTTSKHDVVITNLTGWILLIVY